jgi:hypothetical protein
VPGPPHLVRAAIIELGMQNREVAKDVGEQERSEATADPLVAMCASEMLVRLIESKY